MQPIGSQEGSQAIIEARALTAAPIVSPDPVDAFQRYDRGRRPTAMNEITLRNRQLGRRRRFNSPRRARPQASGASTR